jgi:TRAP-type C4-dicarboxylate transport system substrate-binding protein
MRPIERRCLLASLSAALALPRLALGATARLRFATLVPRGSLYHRVLLEIGEAWRRAEGLEGGFTVFTDGVQGDELDIVRRMRIGQLNGAMISVVGLGAIEPGVTALQYMPLMFRSWEEVDAASQRLRPLLEQRIAARGYVVLYWGEAGWVRFFSKTPAVRPADFQRLQTGLIDAVPVIAGWALAAQVDAIAPHMLDMRWVPITGAAVMTREAWEGISPAGQAAVRAASSRAGDTLRAERERADQAAIEAMRRRGLQVHTTTPEAQAEWQQLVAAAYPRIRGGMVPADVFDLVQQALAEFRAGRALGR